MKNTIVVFGSTTGTCEAIAQNIASKLSVNAINVSDLTAEIIAKNDNLLLGTSTWGCGELQDDWYDGIEKIKKAGLGGKTVAIFGCGDSSGYSDTFCGGMYEIYVAAKEAGANIVGQVSTEGYRYDASQAVVDGQFVGLALDNDNESSMTDGRIDAWVAAISPSL